MSTTTLTASHSGLKSGSLILLTMCLGVLVAQIDTSVVNLALKHINADLRADVSSLQWVVDAYNMTYASLLLTGGVLADLYGRKRIFALGIVLFTVGSVICGFAPDIGTLIAGRTIAGIGAALEVPTTLSILSVTWPDPHERAKPLGIWASCNGIAFVIGPTLGGVLVDYAGWRSIFLMIVPLCVLALALAWRAVPESSAPKGRHLDLRGQGLAILTLGGLSLAVIEGPRLGWTSSLVIGAAVVFIVALAAFLRVEARTPGAMMPLDLFRSRALSASLAVAALMTFGMYAMLFLTPLYLQTVQGTSALTAGLELLPMSLAFVIVAQLSGALTNRFGPRIMTCCGMGGMGIGMVMMAFAVTGGSLLSIEAALLVIASVSASIPRRCRTSRSRACRRTAPGPPPASSTRRAWSAQHSASRCSACCSPCTAALRMPQASACPIGSAARPSCSAWCWHSSSSARMRSPRRNSARAAHQNKTPRNMRGVLLSCSAA